MTHSFNIEVAEKYGMREAVIIHNFAFWIKKNIANKKNFHDNNYWTYNSTSAFKELFPYLSESQIYRTLKNLEDLGVIKTGNYNKMKFDQTKWYCIIDKWILQIYGIHFTNLQNGDYKIERPIPDNKPYIKPNKEKGFSEFWNKYHKITGKKKTDKESALKKWKRLSSKEKKLALKNIESYYKSINPNYCKKARTYLNDKNFNDEFGPKNKELKPYSVDWYKKTIEQVKKLNKGEEMSRKVEYYKKECLKRNGIKI